MDQQNEPVFPSVERLRGAGHLFQPVGLFQPINLIQPAGDWIRSVANAIRRVNRER